MGRISARQMGLDPELREALGAHENCKCLAEALVHHGRRVRTMEKNGGGSPAAITTVLRALEKRVDQVDSRNRVLTTLAKATTHGAIRRGLRLTTQRASRTLEVTGGQIIAFTQAEDGDYVAGLLPVPAISPLRFAMVVGAAHGGTSSEVPELCAGDADGRLIPQPPGTFRVDLLFVIPDDEHEGQRMVGWYLAIGAATDVTKLQDTDNIPSPPLPAVEGVGCLPLYRIITKQGNRGISRAVQVANRVNGV